MAYADRDNGAFKPAGLAAATILNGTVVAALLLIAPQIVKVPDFPITIAEEVTLEPPKIEKTETPKIVVPKVEQTVTPPSAVPVPIPYEPPLTRPIEETAPLTPPFAPIEQVAPIKPVIAPVLKAAKFDPRYVSRLQPDYPPTCARAEIEGSVTVKVRIGTDGRVAAVEVLRSDHEDFSRVTQEAALRKWRFIAATRDGEAVESWKEMTVRFQIPD